MTTQTKTPRHHRWPHLPAAPWRFAGHSVAKHQACPGAPIQPGASCDHCGTGISDVYTFEATRTGERFKVGCVCVDKMIREAGKPTNALAAAREHARKERNKRARERAAGRRKADKARARELLEAHREAAEAVPSPNKWRAEQGDTLANWADWMLSCGGGPAAKRVIVALEGLAN